MENRTIENINTIKLNRFDHSLLIYTDTKKEEYFFIQLIGFHNRCIAIKIDLCLLTTKSESTKQFPCQSS